MSNLNEDIKSTDRSSVILPGGMDEIDDSELENTGLMMMRRTTRALLVRAPNSLLRVINYIHIA